jgi:hypothetical protein
MRRRWMWAFGWCASSDALFPFICCRYDDGQLDHEETRR